MNLDIVRNVILDHVGLSSTPFHHHTFAPDRLSLPASSLASP